MVLAAHLLVGKSHGPVDPLWTPPLFLQYAEYGQMAVLLFFVISGYVIGLSNVKEWTASGSLHYLWRRLLRLMPMNFVAVILTCLLVSAPGWHVILGNTLFLQNDLGYFGRILPVLAGNGNLWSLNYEMLYYLLFLLVWARFIPLKSAFLICLLIWGSGFIVSQRWMFVVCYSAGLLFWLGGLAVSRLPTDKDNLTPVPWPSIVLAAMATWKLTFAKTSFGRFGLYVGNLNGTYVHPAQIEFLPYALWFILVLTGRKPRGLICLQVYCLLYPLVALSWKVFRGRYEFAGITAFATILVAVSFVLWKWRPSFTGIRFFAPVGLISYGIYATARPIQLALGTHGTFFAGTAYTWAARCLLTLALSALLAWIFDYWLQRKLRSFA